MVVVRRKVEADQTEILHAIQEIKSLILAHTKSFWWKVTQVGLPVVLAAILSFVVWLAQNNITQKLSLESTKFSAELGRRQLLFEKRLNAYETLYNKAEAAYLSMKAENSAAKQKKLDDDAGALSDLANQSRILSSSALSGLLVKMWLAAAQSRDPSKTQALLEQVARQMRADLKIDEMDQIPPVASSKPGSARPGLR